MPSQEGEAINLFVVQYVGLTRGLYTFSENLSGENLLSEKNAAQLSALKQAVFSDKFTNYPDFSWAWFFTVKVAMGAGAACRDMQGPTFIKCQFCTQRTALYLLRHQVQITEITHMFTCLV